MKLWSIIFINTYKLQDILLRRTAIFSFEIVHFKVVLNSSSIAEKADIWVVFCYPAFQQFALFV